MKGPTVAGVAGRISDRPVVGTGLGIGALMVIGGAATTGRGGPGGVDLERGGARDGGVPQRRGGRHDRARQRHGGLVVGQVELRARRRGRRGDGARRDHPVQRDVADRRARAVQLVRRGVGERRRRDGGRTARTCPPAPATNPVMTAATARPLRLDLAIIPPLFGGTFTSTTCHVPPRSPEPAALPRSSGSRLGGHHDARGRSPATPPRNVTESRPPRHHHD